MYGTRRVMFDRDGRAYFLGKYEGEEGGSSIRIGQIMKTTTKVDAYFCNGRLIGSFDTKLEAKIAMFNAAKKVEDCFIGKNEYIDGKGKVYRKGKHE